MMWLYLQKKKIASVYVIFWESTEIVAPPYSEKMQSDDGDADHRRTILIRSQIPKSGNDGKQFHLLY